MNRVGIRRRFTPQLADCCWMQKIWKFPIDAGNYFRCLMSQEFPEQWIRSPPSLVTRDTFSGDNKSADLHLQPPAPDLTSLGEVRGLLSRSALLLTEWRKQTCGCSSSDAKRGNCKLWAAAAESLRCTNVQTAAVAARYSPAQLKLAGQTRSLWLHNTKLIAIFTPAWCNAGEESL